jgi:hypothetical protein
LLGALVSAGATVDGATESGEAWLERVIELGTPASPNVDHDVDAPRPVVRAVLLLVG